MFEKELPDFEPTESWIKSFLKERTTQKVFEVLSHLDGSAPRGYFVQNETFNEKENFQNQILNELDIQSDSKNKLPGNLNTNLSQVNQMETLQYDYQFENSDINSIETISGIGVNHYQSLMNSDYNFTNLQHANSNTEQFNELSDTLSNQETIFKIDDLSRIVSNQDTDMNTNEELSKYVYILKRVRNEVANSSEMEITFSISKPCSSKKLAKMHAAKSIFMKIFHSNEREALLHSLELLYTKSKKSSSQNINNNPVSQFVSECSKRFITIQPWKYLSNPTVHPILFGAHTKLHTIDNQEFIISTPVQYKSHKQAKMEACIQGLKILEQYSLEQEHSNIENGMIILPPLIEQNYISLSGIVLNLNFFQVSIYENQENIGILTRINLKEEDFQDKRIFFNLIQLHKISLNSELLEEIIQWYKIIEKLCKVDQYIHEDYIPFIPVPVKNKTIDWNELRFPKFNNIKNEELGISICKLMHLIHVEIIQLALRKQLYSNLYPLIRKYSDLYSLSLTKVDSNQAIGEEGVRLLTSIGIFFLFHEVDKGQLSLKRDSFMSNKLLFTKISTRNLQVYRQTQLSLPIRSIFSPFYCRPMGYKKITNIVYNIAGAILHGNSHEERYKKLISYLKEWNIIEIPDWDYQFFRTIESYKEKEIQKDSWPIEYESIYLAIVQHLKYEIQIENILFEAVFDGGRLAFLGDAILGFTCEELLLSEDPELDASTLSLFKQISVSNLQFSNIASILINSLSTESQVSERFNITAKSLKIRSVKNKADIWEAVCGAIFLDLLLQFKDIDTAVTKFSNIISSIWQPYLHMLVSNNMLTK